MFPNEARPVASANFENTHDMVGHGDPFRDIAPFQAAARMTSCEPSVGPLLDALLVWLHYIPERARRVRSAKGLPAGLREQTRTPAGGAWRAWRSGTRFRFVSARSVSRTGEPRVRAEFFNRDGRFMAAGIWQRRGGGWMLELPSADTAESVTFKLPVFPMAEL